MKENHVCLGAIDRLTAVAGILLVLMLASCDKEAAVATGKPKQSSYSNDYIPMEGTAMRKWDPKVDDKDCFDSPENCAPSEAVIQDMPAVWWWHNSAGHGGIHIGPIVIEWSSPVPGAPIFRTLEYRGAFLGNFTRLGITSQEELDNLDNPTFYATLFPGLTDVQRAMLYSGQHNTAIGNNEENGRYFIFVATKDKSLADAYRSPALVIPFMPGN